MKKKLIYKALSLALSATILATSLPITSFASEKDATSVETVTELSEVSENSVAEDDDAEEATEETTETAEEVADETTETTEEVADEVKTSVIWDFDWKNATDEELSEVIYATDFETLGYWLDSMNEEDFNAILARETCLHDKVESTDYDVADDGTMTPIQSTEVVEMYEYALQYVDGQKGYLTYNNSSGYYSYKFQIGATTYTYKMSISGVEKNQNLSTAQTVTLALTIPSGVPGWLQFSSNAGTSSTSVKLRPNLSGSAACMTLRCGFSFVKPQGWVLSHSSSSITKDSCIYYYDGGLYETNQNKLVSDGDSSIKRTWSLLAYVNLVDAGFDLYKVEDGLETKTAEGTHGVFNFKLEPITYYVVYNGNGANGGSTAAQACVYDTSYTPSPNGFTRNYTITYNANGGTASKANEVVSYAFKGWGLNNSQTVTHSPSTAYSNLGTTHNTTAGTFYAIWEPKSTNLATATRTGYKFNKWNNDYTGGQAFTPTANVNMVASWTPINYTIKFDSNGGSACSNIAAKYDQNVNLTQPTKQGYIFKGWQGATSTYTTTAKNLTTTDGQTIELRATWAPRTDTPYKVVKYFEQEAESGIYPEGQKIEENYTGTTDTLVTITPEAVDLYEIPAAQTATIKADGSTTIVFYYKAIKQDVNYTVEHHVKNPTTGKYEKFEQQTLTAKEGEVVTPALSQKAIDQSNSYKGYTGVKPQTQTVTVAAGTVVKYYYDVTKNAETPTTPDPTPNPNPGSGLTDKDIDEIARRIKEGLSFNMEIEGVDYEIIQNPDGTMTIKFGTTTEERVVIPDVIQVGDKVYRVTEINEKAFKDNQTIKEVVISGNIATIGTSAFENCTSLKTVSLNEGLVTIGTSAFKGCTLLETIKLPSTVQTISNSAFENCTALKSVSLNEGLVKIGNKAFYNCKSLTKIKIPKTVLKIGTSCFEKCIKLKSVTFAAEAQLLTIGKRIFYGCSALTKIKLPGKLTNISEKAFYNCKKLSSVTIGKNVTTIGISSFSNTAITKITLPTKVQKIYKKAFYNCKKLKKVTVKSKALTQVGSKAFKKCKKGIKFHIPSARKSDYMKLFKGKY